MGLHLNQSGELKVFISTREPTCDECNENLGSKAWITLAGEKGALCLSRADAYNQAFTIHLNDQAKMLGKRGRREEKTQCHSQN
jgi:hypothetical protein